MELNRDKNETKSAQAHSTGRGFFVCGFFGYHLFNYGGSALDENVGGFLRNPRRNCDVDALKGSQREAFVSLRAPEDSPSAHPIAPAAPAPAASAPAAPAPAPAASAASVALSAKPVRADFP